MDSNVTVLFLWQYVFHVEMTCGGCSAAVERVMKKNDRELNLLNQPQEI